MVLIFISLMTNGVECLFMFLFITWISTLVNCLLTYFAHLLIGLFMFFTVQFESCLYILDWFFLVIGVFWQFNYDAPLCFFSCFFCLGSVQLLGFVGFSFMKLEKILTIVSLNICSVPVFFPGALITYILNVSYCPRALLDFLGVFFHLCFSLDIS